MEAWGWGWEWVREEWEEWVREEWVWEVDMAIPSPVRLVMPRSMAAALAAVPASVVAALVLVEALGVDTDMEVEPVAVEASAARTALNMVLLVE